MEVEDYNCWLSLGDLASQRPVLLHKFVDRLAIRLFDFVSGSGSGSRDSGGKLQFSHRNRRQRLLRNMMLVTFSVLALGKMVCARGSNNNY